MRRHRTWVGPAGFMLFLGFAVGTVLGVGCPQPGAPLRPVNIVAKSVLAGDWTSATLYLPFDDTLVGFEARDQETNTLAPTEELDRSADGEDIIYDEYVYVWTSEVKGQKVGNQIDYLYSGPCHDVVSITVDDIDGDGKCNETALEQTDFIDIYIVTVNLEAVDVPEEQEETPGAYIPLNAAPRCFLWVDQGRP